MRTLREGCVGDDVVSWQAFLHGLEARLAGLTITGTFDRATAAATRVYQRSRGLAQDGVAGARTVGTAMARDGFDPLTDEGHSDRTSRAWPPLIAGFTSMSRDERDRTLGAPVFFPAPVPGNLEAVKLDQSWVQRNIVAVEVPELAHSGITGAPEGGRVYCHRLAGPRLVELFARWAEAGLIDRVLAWGGMWSPRFIRGSRTVLSNHALGAAFDLNVPWNALGSAGALVGEHGCVRELVGIAAEQGWFWGGWFQQRPDPMHFELARA